MSSIKKLLAALLLLLPVLPAHARGGLVLNEEKAVAYALENNLLVLSSREQAEAARARAAGASSGFYPQLQAVGYYARYRDYPFFPLDDSAGYSLQLTQNIFTGGRLTAGRAAALSGMEAAGYAKEEAAARVRFMVKEVFYGAILAEEFLRINEEALGLAEEMLETIRARFERGEASNYELLRQRVEAANVRSEVSRARSRVETSKNALRQVLGTAPDAAISLEGGLEYLPVDIDRAEVKELAVSRRPRVREMKSLAESAGMGVRAARSGYYPSVMLGLANIGSRGFALGGAASAGASDEFTLDTDGWDVYWEARLSIAVPIFQGGLTRARVDESMAEEKMARFALDQAKKDVEIEVENAFLEIMSAAERVDFQKENVETAKQAYDIIRERYLAGEASHLDVMDARLALSESELNYADSLKEHIVARARLEFASGEPVF